VPGPLQPAPTIPLQRIGEAIPLSRESSFSSTTSLARGDGLTPRVSRFSIETHAKDGVLEGANAVLETLLKQNETQRAVLDELFGMRLGGLRNAKEASKTLDLHPTTPPSPAHPPTNSLSQQSTTTPNEAVASAGVGPLRLTTHMDLLGNMQTINTQVQSVLKENELLKRDNEVLRRELDSLRKTLAMTTGTSPPSSSAVAVTLDTQNVISGAAVLPNPANTPSTAESNTQRTSNTSSTSQLK